MIKKFCAILLGISGLVANTFAIEDFNATQGLVIEYELLPHIPQIFANTFFWKITANCTISSPLTTNSISITVLNKSGTLNDMPLSTGQSIVWTVHPGDVLKIGAESGGKVELTNLEDKPIKAKCSPA